MPDDVDASGAHALQRPPEEQDAELGRRGARADGAPDGHYEDCGLNRGVAAEDVGDLGPEGEEGGRCQVEDGDYPVELLDLACIIVWDS